MIRHFKAMAELSAYQAKNRMVASFQKGPVTFIILSILGIAFYVGYLIPSWLLLQFIYNQEVYGVLLASKLIEILLYIASGVALMSSLTNAIAHFYLSKDLELQASLPISFSTWFIWRFGQVFVQSNWMLLLFAIPLICMYLHLGDSPVYVLVLGGLTLTVVSSFPVMMATLLCLVLVKVFPARRIHQVFLVVSVLLVSLVIFLFRYMEPEKFIGPGGMDRFRGFVDLMDPGAQPWNPARWAYNVIVSVGNARWSAALPHAVKLLTTFGLGFGLLMFAGQRLYRQSWDRALQSLSGEGGMDDGRRRESWLSKALSQPRMHQEAREILLFLRDPSQWSQVFVLIALLGLYLFSLTKIPSNPFGGTMYTLALGSAAFIAFITLSIASRFLFTSFSTDGQAIWIMKTAPVGKLGYVRSKLVVFGLPTLIFSQMLCLGSGLIIGLTLPQIGLLALHSLWDASLLILAALAFGMLFISPNEENPVKLIFSPGGVLLMAAGLCITALHVSLRLSHNSPVINELLMKVGWPNLHSGFAAWYFSGLILAEILLVAYLIRRGVRHLESGEFAVG